MHSMAALGPYQKSTFAKSNFAHRCHRSTWSHNVRSMFVSHVITYIGSTLDICWPKTVAKTAGCCPFYVSGYVVVVVLADSLSLQLSILFVFGSCFVMQYFVYFLVLYIISKGVARTLKKVTHIKGRLLYQAMIFYNCVPFQNGNFSKRKELAPRGSEFFPLIAVP